MNKRIAAIGLVAVVLMVCAAGNVAAYDKKAGGHGGGIDEKIFGKAHMIMANAEELKLTEEQIKGIKEWKLEAKKQNIRQDAEIEVFKLDIYSKLWDNEMDPATLYGLIDQLYGLKATKAKSMIEAYGKLMNILTDEQKAALKGLCRKSLSDKCPKR
ncbi:MAG: Spy/CpxP family protein refolding chaperone [Candidatus Omnitrophica bacterium]|nr:Spy/CpxP family protein refolding chaperone [Candidatus Omnitrophota bacterium]